MLQNKTSTEGVLYLLRSVVADLPVERDIFTSKLVRERPSRSDRTPHHLLFVLNWCK